MANYEIRKKANIGSSSLILIFIVLCLATFGILSLSNSSRERRLAEKNAAAVTEYYRADSQATLFAAEMDRLLQSCWKEGQPEQTKAGMQKQAGDYYQPEGDIFCADIAMAAGQALRVELAADWEKGELQVRTWHVYQSVDYEIDQSVPVWTGG